MQKQLGFAKYLLAAIRIEISLQCTMVITTEPDGIRKFYRHEAIREKTVEKMDRWTTKQLIRKTVSGHLKDIVKRDDDITTSSRARDTAGGGRGHYQHDHNHNNTKEERRSSSSKKEKKKENQFEMF